MPGVSSFFLSWISKIFCDFYLCDACYMCCLTHPPWFYSPNNISRRVKIWSFSLSSVLHSLCYFLSLTSANFVLKTYLLCVISLVGEPNRRPVVTCFNLLVFYCAGHCRPLSPQAGSGRFQLSAVRYCLLMLLLAYESWGTFEPVHSWWNIT